MTWKVTTEGYGKCEGIKAVMTFDTVEEAYEHMDVLDKRHHRYFEYKMHFYPPK